MNSIISEQPLEEFVRARLQCQSRSAPHGFSEETLWYVGRLLVSFVESRQLFNIDRGGTRLPVLAFLFRDANAASSMRERVLLLRKLGDTALFVGALFPEKYLRHGLGADYFVGMGGGAYSSLAESCSAQKGLYEELSSRFPSVMQLVAHVCSKDLAYDARDIIELHDRWQVTGSPIAEKQLRSLGIALNESSGRSH